MSFLKILTAALPKQLVVLQKFAGFPFGLTSVIGIFSSRVISDQVSESNVLKRHCRVFLNTHWILCDQRLQLGSITTQGSACVFGCPVLPGYVCRALCVRKGSYVYREEGESPGMSVDARWRT